MSTTASLDQMAISLVPSLSRSLADQFNIFRVMHHGTHEKQLSNVFAWLLRPDASHELGDAFQRIFLERINDYGSASEWLPVSGYRVTQEVDTSGPEENCKDIADIVLSRSDACVVVENYGTSDGHDHDYQRYLRYGSSGDRRAVVALLCITHEPHLQTCGWQHAAVVTYADLLQDLKNWIGNNKGWQTEHSEQFYFINQLFQHFLEGPKTMTTNDQVAFISAMCKSGESARFGHRPQEVAAQEFANLIGQHAKRQFDEARTFLGEVKKSLRLYVEGVVVEQVNAHLGERAFHSGKANFSGQWEWLVKLDSEVSNPSVYVAFGPTAVVENSCLAEPLESPDYSSLLVVRAGESGDAEHIVPTTVGLDEVSGLTPGDTRVRDAVLEVLGRL